MLSSSRFVRISAPLALLFFFAAAFAVENVAPPAPNSDPTYQQLRNLGLSGEAVAVKDFTLKRDAATFHLHSGTVCFVTPVQGKVTGAVFVGDGNMILEPPTAIERASLRLLSRQSEFVEQYKNLVLRFTDNTYDELKAAGSTASSGCDAGPLRDSQHAMRHERELRYNLEGRILQDVLGTAPGGLFVAFVQGQNYSDKEIYAIDPHGAPPLLDPPIAYGQHSVMPQLLVPPVGPEEVELVTYGENNVGNWAAFHLAEEYKSGTANSSQNNRSIRIEHQGLDTTIEKNATLTGKATTTFVSQVDGLRVVPFDLYGTLRVQSVIAEGGQQLSCIQEDRENDAMFFSVILPKPLSAGEKYTLTTTYAGKDAVTAEGSGNYYPVARENWYPSAAGAAFGEYTTYDLTFHIPKGMKIAATGTLVSESNEGSQNVTVWKSEVPQVVAGFNFGKFKMEEAKMTKPEYLVQSYANEDPPEWVRALQHYAGDMAAPSNKYGLSETHAEVALGNMNTTQLGKKAMSDGELAIELYTDYFGPVPYKRIAMTQQTACDYGQSWPALVFLPLCSFFDSNVRNQLGMEWGSRGYWKIVAPHEVAHQWWGHDVGFNSYRDQWMSEGFADMSASLFIQMIEKNPKKFIEFWDDEREFLTMHNKEGYRAIDAGPLTLGYRLNNSRTGFNVTRLLIYPKGAYILHMVRMMMWDRQTGDQNFKATMQDFVKTYSGRTATTEDFKAILEKHQTPEMAALGGGRMDWFFDEYVYATALPSYDMRASFDSDPSGGVVLNFKLTQSNVADSFRMLVPIYLEMADGRILPLGRARLIGNTSLEQKVPLKGLKDKPRRAMINYFDDVLASAK